MRLLTFLLALTFAVTIYAAEAVPAKVAEKAVVAPAKVEKVVTVKKHVKKHAAKKAIAKKVVVAPVTAPATK